MRPISLTMQAFGSYGQKTVINFRRPKQNLFLVTGDTGAGKTTIFDAIVFALYGSVSSSGKVKDGNKLQSQFVGEDIEPFVELEFSEKRGGDTENYKVRRIPKHEQSKKRGVGVTDKPEEVSLFMPKGDEYSGSIKETNNKLVEIVGLDREQFMQVAMIAQGEFMELLRAKSDKRKEIFRKLFDTEIYEKIVNKLDERRKDGNKEIAEIRTACQTEIGHIVIPSDDEKYAELEELKYSVMSSDKMNITELNEFMEGLKLLCGRLSKKEKSLQMSCNDASKEKEDAFEAYAKADELSKVFNRLKKAEEEIKECEAEQTDIDKAEKLLSSINAAYDVKAVYQGYEDALNARRDTEGKLNKQKEKIKPLEKKYNEASTREHEAFEKQKSIADDYAKTDERVQKSLDILDKIGEQENKFESANKQREEAENAKQRADKEYKDYEEKIGRWNKDIESLEGINARLEKWRRKNDEINEILEEIKNLENDLEAISNQKNLSQKAEETYEKKRDEYEEKNNEYLEKQNIFFDAQAGYLATEKLEPGKPCPVCGSIEHPNPCVMSNEGKDITRETIDLLAKEVSDCSAAREEASAKAGSAKDLLEEKEKEYKKDFSSLKGKMEKNDFKVNDNLSLSDVEEMADKKKKDLDIEEVNLRESSSRYESLKEKLGESEDKKAKLKQKCDEAECDLTKKRDEFLNIKNTLSNLNEQKDYKTRSDAEGAREKAKKEKDNAEEKYNFEKNEVEKLKQDLDGTNALIEQYEGELPDQKEKEKNRKKEYEDALTKHGLLEEKWQDVVSHYSKEYADELREEISDYKEKKKSAERSRNEAGEQIGGRKRPNLEELESNRDRANEKYRKAQSDYEEIKNTYKTDKDTYDKLASQVEKRSEVVKKQEEIDKLYNRLHGNVKDGKMDVESFVQRNYLQSILNAANKHFCEMTAGQYELRMMDIEDAGKGRENHGLDLIVYSRVTGKKREVDTLSGGESFMAALAMALGMADQIRQSSSSVNLDIMFIDEGFGSLDDQSRNNACRVLRGMAGGDKLIGIISHVTELKQQIDDQLIVTKDDKGSHVRWQTS